MSILRFLGRPFVALGRLLLRLGVKTVKLTMIGLASAALLLVLDALLLGKLKAPQELPPPEDGTG